MEVIINQIEKRSWVEVDLSQLKRNYLTYKQTLRRSSNIMPVIKADAYGHGDVQVARMLYDNGVRMFAVSNIDEAVGLREAGVKGEILILGYSSPVYARILYENDLTQTIVSEEYAQLLLDYNIKIKCQFAVDTGMNRIGLDGDDPKECERIIRKYYDLLCINGLFTHLCVADTDDDVSRVFTNQQIEKFKNVVDLIKDLELPYIHCMNSAGGLFYLDKSERYDSIGNIVRLGIILYGHHPNESNQLPAGIEPALSWKSIISQVKTVHKGETIGYGRTYKADKDRVIATVTTGYADGYNRLLSNKGHVLIKGQRAPIVGRICMDQMLIDVTDIEDVNVSDKVVLIGKSGDVTYTADDMAKDLGTIGYEVLCNISKRVQRFYINSNQSL